MRIRKKRPNLADAHAFYKRGYYSAEGAGFVSTAEGVAEAERISEELCRISTKGIPRTRNLEYMVLKCHLITEYALTQFIRFMATPVVEEKSIRFTYADKLNVAYLMGFGATEPVLILSLELLNKARNQVAHTFELDVSLVNELLRINSDQYECFSAPGLTEPLRGLKQITQFVCGLTSGFILASAHSSG